MSSIQSFKVPTKQGIGRTLNDTLIRKMGYTHSSMVRGWSTQYSGWTSEETETGFVVGYVRAQGMWGSRGKTEQEIADHQEMIVRTIDINIQKMFTALVAKGYDASLVGQTIFVNKVAVQS